MTVDDLNGPCGDRLYHSDMNVNMFRVVMNGGAPNCGAFQGFLFRQLVHGGPGILFQLSGVNLPG